MDAILLTDYGGLDKLHFETVPSPRPKAGEVRIKVSSTSVNPIDFKIRSGSAKERFPQQLPSILGRDVAGEVVELGPGVTAFAKGDKVLGLAFHTYAQELTASADVLTKLPEGLDLLEAGALPLVLTTGAQLVDHAGIRPDQTVLVTGALGSVGRTAVFVARKRGAKVLAGVRAKDFSAAKELGVDGIVAIDADPLELPELDAIADTIGGETLRRLLPFVRAGGIVGTVVAGADLGKGFDVTIHRFMAQPDREQLAELASAVARGELHIPIVERFPLEKAAEAQRVAEGGPGGKVLLLP